MNELQSKEQQNDLISESGLSRTLDIFFQMKDSRTNLEESLFDDVYAGVLNIVRDEIFPTVKEDPKFVE